MTQNNTAKTNGASDEVDIALVGAGIMSATLGAMLRELEPSWSQIILERLDAPAMESSSPWNNAGTGHSALCEQNYTPIKHGRVDIHKAILINEKFQVSRQFWSHQVNNGVLHDPQAFINPVDHISFARGEEQITFLKARYDALKNQKLFAGMDFVDTVEGFSERLPIMAEGRDFSEPVAYASNVNGTDVNFGALTKQFLTAAKAAGTEIRYGNEVTTVKRSGESWKLKVKNVHTGDQYVVKAKFVFVGAGGYALDLLRKAGVPEVNGYAGFPVSGMWLRSTNQELIDAHDAKVYGKAQVGAPPMSVPHLDTRVINGKKGLLFGPFGGWTPKFLKKGSYLDLFKSIRPDNIPSYLGVAVQEWKLTKYLVEEVTKNTDARIADLREYVPTARAEDWESIVAGQRVQVIKPTAAPRFGSLEFGTALVNSIDGSIAGLLGASPGASIAPAAMVELIERCFGEYLIDWAPKIYEMIPSYNKKLSDNPDLYDELWEYTQKTLKLQR
ncbi:malate dehydrogenase (quinone) [Corynebacterium uterequi]|uniref:Probable malate:quinone oxidoreductase n=1 Tax=Corynebacterium uterequi TaxID=1072256 RepID=A0A0G3HD81_9CORY|nr:malate dehydrogenase (quinone) [Corynebacterium uterequi]AKK11341.1 malate:quinone-oxidoreductase [Corynebacterium uterequi]